MMLIKKRISLAAMLCLVTALTLRADVVTFNVNESISDYDETGLQNTQVLTGYTGVVDTIEVSLRISGDPLAFGGDFYASLQCDNGGYAVLLNRIGTTTINPLGYGINGFDITFSLGINDIHLAENYTPTYDADGRLTGAWGADARNIDPGIVLDSDSRTADLDAFNGTNPNGSWTLFVADMNLNGTATLDSWGLDIGVVPEPASVLLLLGGASLLGLFRRFFSKV